MNTNKFDHLIPEVSNTLTEIFMKELSIRREFREDVEDVDASSLLNMTVGTFVSSLINILDKIKENTDSESKLISNIELAKTSLIKAIEDLPFVSKVKFI